MRVRPRRTPEHRTQRSVLKPSVARGLHHRLSPRQRQTFIAILVAGAAHAYPANHLARPVQRQPSVQRRDPRVRPVGNGSPVVHDLLSIDEAYPARCTQRCTPCVRRSGRPSRTRRPSAPGTPVRRSHPPPQPRKDVRWRWQPPSQRPPPAEHLPEPIVSLVGIVTPSSCSVRSLLPFRPLLP